MDRNKNIQNDKMNWLYPIKTSTINFSPPGNERDAKDLTRLRSLNIRYVLNVTSHVPQMHECPDIRYKRIPASDSAQQNLRQYFEEAIEYIGESCLNMWSFFPFLISFLYLFLSVYGWEWGEECIFVVVCLSTNYQTVGKKTNINVRTWTQIKW